jgi:hypothetical protein
VVVYTSNPTYMAGGGSQEDLKVEASQAKVVAISCLKK